jgi:two-component system NtrC family sensor kinase
MGWIRSSFLATAANGWGGYMAVHDQHHAEPTLACELFQPAQPLPVSAEVPMSQRVEEPKQERPGAATVLVVDNDVEFLKTIESWLNRQGYHAVTTCSIGEGQAALERTPVQVLLVNPVLGAGEAFAWQDAVRSRLPQLPIIAIAGESERGLVSQVYRHGATSFLIKPIDLNTLEVTLRRCLHLDGFFHGDTRNPELTAILEIQHALASGMPMPEVLDLLLQQMIRYSHADSASVMLIDSDRKTMIIAASYGLTDDVRGQKVAVGERIAGWVAENNQPQVIIGSAGNDPRMAGAVRKREPMVGMCLPMRGRHEVVGVLSVSRLKDEGVFTHDAVDLGILLGAEVARAIERSAASESQKDLERNVMRHDKLVTIGELASGVAHEINNPLGYVNSNVSSIKEYFDEVLPLLRQLVNNEHGANPQSVLSAAAGIDLGYIINDLPICIQETIEGIKRVLKIVADLKAFARDDLEAKEKGDVNQILDGAVNIVWNQIKYKADLVREYGDLPTIMCYPSQLGQVFLNMLYNSAQSIERNGHIVLRTRIERDTIVVEVEDNGHGMSPEVQNRIFEPFFTTKPHGVGTGLGLKIARKIVERHEGTISVSSIKGKGTVFRVSLPIATTSERS